MSGIWLAALGSALLHAIWQGLVIAGAVEGVVRVAGPSAPRLRHRVGVMGLALLAAGFLATFLLVLLGAWTELAAPAVQGAAAAEPVLAPRVLRGLGWIWLVTTCYGIARLVVGLLAVRRLAGSAASVRERALWRALREARKRVRFPGRVSLLEAAELDSPVVVGWRRPAVLLPAGFSRVLGHEQRVAVLAHELEHVRRADFRTGVLIRALQIVVGFHPAAVLLARRVAQAREECCDDRVSACVDALVYARALERLERVRPGGVRLHLAPAASVTTARILRLLRPARFRAAPAVLALAVAALAVTTAALASGPRYQGEGAALADRLLPLLTINANDPAGAFTLALRAGRAVAATVGGVPVPRDRLVQVGDSIRILEADGAPHVTVQVARGGTGISWSARINARPAP